MGAGPQVSMGRRVVNVSKEIALKCSCVKNHSNLT